MIGRLTGIIDSHTVNPLIIDVHGVGYVVHVPERYLASVKPGKTHTLLIHSHIREDAFDLYGFATMQELRLFELLLTVSGIGPKTASRLTYYLLRAPENRGVLVEPLSGAPRASAG